MQLIGSVRTSTWLTVKAKLDTRSYALGVKVDDAEMGGLAITPDAFHGEWTPPFNPRRSEAPR